MAAALIGTAVLLLLIFLRVPIALALGVVGFVGFWQLTGWRPAFALLGQTLRDSALSYSLVVIPLFILMGNFLTGAGLSRALYHAAYVFVGHRRGGLAVSTVLACGGFSAVCGSSLATTATMGQVAMPSMRAYGYDDRLAAGVIAAGGTLGILIPPSVILIIYGLMTETHIGKLFAAGLLPGLVGMALYWGVIWLQATVDPAMGPRGERSDWPRRLAALRQIWGVALLIVVVLGGIYGGFFTPTEAAGVGAFFAFVFAVASRGMGFSDILEVLVETAKTTAALFAVLIGAMMFAQFINFSGMHRTLLGFVDSLDVAPVVIILLIVLLFLILGCVLESLSMILLTVPILFPVVVGLGYDPIWFGILVVIAVEVGLITPPIGINIFVLKSVVRDLGTGTAFRGVLPFWAADIVRLGLLVAFPGMALMLPHWFFG
ncbi:MAG: TRAP transporter large permease [Pararhodobacter sp.]|nr:TRAP transporter large permease [Pararhodobacter sp.]